MLKLMKYEFKKQMFSKIIIAAILGVLTLYFGIACVIDKETHAHCDYADIYCNGFCRTVYSSRKFKCLR